MVSRWARTRIWAQHLSYCWALAQLLGSRTVHAEAAPDRLRPASYYAVHGSITSVLMMSSAVLRALPSHGGGADPVWFPGDFGLRSSTAVDAAGLSDALLWLGLSTPLVFEAARGEGSHFLNSGMVYAETLSATVFFNSLAKTVFRRPRPYTYQLTQQEDEVTRDDWYVSFYSGHASAAFAAATSGSLLFGEGSTRRSVRTAVWCGELALAAMTADLRVRAGKHYYSDVVTGAIVGATLGFMVPNLHGLRYRPSTAEYAAAAGGVVLGVTLSQLVPYRRAEKAAPLQSLRLHAIPVADGLTLNASGDW